MKILYSAGRFTSSKYQLYQFVKNLPNHYTLKTSGYQNHIPFNVDYTLNFIDSYKKNDIFTNSNLAIFADQIKKYKPDLIISDMCLYSSIIGIELNIPVWQYNPYLILWSYGYSNNLSPIDFNIYFKKLHNKKYYEYILSNSERLFANTHIIKSFVKTEQKEKRKLLYNVEWITPYHEVAKNNEFCKRNCVLSDDISYQGNALIRQYYNNTINQSLSNRISFDNLNNNNILDNQGEYYCHLKNSEIIITEPNPLFLSDCYYNQKHCYILCDERYPMEDHLMATINNSLNNSEFLSKFLLRNLFTKKSSINIENKIFIHNKIQEIL